MDQGIWKETVRKNADKKIMGPCNRDRQDKDGKGEGERHFGLTNTRVC